MDTRQAQRILLFMGIVGAFAILVASWSVFGVSVETTNIYGVEGIRARLAAVKPGTVELSFLLGILSLPLLVAGTTGWMLELGTAEKRIRWTMMAGIGAWILVEGAFVGAIRILAANIGHLPVDTPWPEELEIILTGLSVLSIGSTFVLWLFLAAAIWLEKLPVPRQWALLSPGVLLVGFLALAWLSGLITGSYPARGYVLAPWLALILSFGSLLVYRVRKPL